MTQDLRTPKQKLREVEHNRIVNTYLSYKSNPEYAQFSDNRIFDAIAHDPQNSVSTVCGVRAILVKAGVYTNKR